jgi:hypothetical protein
MRNARERGVALLITLGLLALLGAASLAVILMTSSDTMINGYYRNYRGSFYAADSGVNVVVEAMKNGIATSANPAAAGAPLPIAGGALPAAGVSANAPIPAGLTASYAPFQADYYKVGDAGSWNSQFRMIGNPGGAPVIGQPSFQWVCRAGDGNCPGDSDFIWQFSYPYTITVQGQSSGSEAEQVTESGVITYSSSPGTVAAGGLPSFSKWAGFIDNFALCQGALVPGTMHGPFFTNQSWNFGNFSNPGYTFADSIGQAGTQVGYINGNKCTAGGATPPKGFRAPTFDKGFQVGANAVQPPSDSYNQEQAVLDGKGAAPCTSNPCGNGSRTPPSGTLLSTMKTVSGVQYPASGSAPTGVYLPMYTNSNGQLTLGSDPALGGDGMAGGFFVNGNASVTLNATVDSANNPTQTYIINQGGTTTTIVVDTATNSTTVSSGSSSQTLAGVPSQIDPNTGAPITQTDPSGNPVAPTMVYVNGQITGMSGTVQNDTGITVTATSNVSITGDITYASQPVDSSDNLVANTNAGVLGIYTPANINLYPDSQGNLTIDASLAMLSGKTNGTAGLATPGGGIGTLTIVGGRSEDQAHGVNIGAGNTFYDQRFAGNFGPPWFPTAQPTAGAPAIPQLQNATVTRLSWQETSR